MDKLILTEKQILTTLQLSGVQKTLLAKITAAATPEVAYEQISDGRNFVANRDTLKRLGLISFEEGSASVTEAGKKVMRDENLMDPSDQLTKDGQQYVQVENPNDIIRSKSGTSVADADRPEADSGADEDAPDNLDDDTGKAFEGFSLLKSINQQPISAASQLVEFNSREIRAMRTGDDLSYALMDKIYEFVVTHDSTWMPYDTQTSDDNDPHNWIADHLDDIVDIIDGPSTK